MACPLTLALTGQRAGTGPAPTLAACHIHVLGLARREILIACLRLPIHDLQVMVYVVGMFRVYKCV